MAWIMDSLRNAIAAVNPMAARGAPIATYGAFTHQLALSAFRSSGMLAKVIRIPADDRVREWRDWQAEKPQIEAIEAEERRLGLIAKVRQAEVLRGIGGGALILAAPGDPATPINVQTLRKGQLQAVNVVSRWQITGQDYVKELTDPAFGTPRYFQMSTDGRATRLHPSRVICFRGDPLPAGAEISDEDAFWGDSRLMRVFREVQNSDDTQRWFSELVKKAKLLRIGIPDLADMVATEAGRSKLAARMQTIAEGENILNATVYSAGSGTEKGGGEDIKDFTMSWNGIPAMMDAFDQRVSAVSDIPFTRLMGRSPAGMNATGQYDDISWSKTVQAGQQLETRPCLEQLDPILLRSAGITDTDKVWWKWAPLWSPTEKETADTFKVEMEAIEKVQATASIPERAFNEAFQNFLEEKGYMPGLSGALAKVPEAERFGLDPDAEGGDDDPSAIQAESEVIQTSADDPAGDGSAGRRRAANDKALDADGA